MSLRLFMLPVEKINNALPKKGVIYDIGCGEGNLSSLLAKSNFMRHVYGIDASKVKIEKAKKQYDNIQNVSFVHTDAVLFSYKQYIGAVLSDFLHHISYSKQEKLLKELSKKVKKNGVMVIKEVDSNEFIRRNLTRLWDFLLYPKDQIYFRTKSEWMQLLQECGFSVRATHEILWFPGSTNLFICTKK